MPAAGGAESIQLKGVRQLSRQLKKAGADLDDLKEENKKAADIVKDEATPHAPVRSGRLKKTLRSSGTRQYGVVRLGTKAVPYAGPIHFGWPKRNITAQPFVSQAAKDAEAEWAQIYQNAVDKIIADITGANYEGE